MRRGLAVACVLGLALTWMAWMVAPQAARLLDTRLLDTPRRMARAQFGAGRPRVSPHETTAATIDGAQMSIVYGRPSMRGREIFGALVPYDAVWCPGADECTKLTSDRDLQFENLKLPAGAYTFWMTPTRQTWTLIFSGDSDAFHTRRNTRLDVGQINLHKESLTEPVEQLTFAIEPAPSGPGGRITMTWARTKVFAPFTVLR